MAQAAVILITDKKEGISAEKLHPGIHRPSRKRSSRTQAGPIDKVSRNWPVHWIDPTCHSHS